MTAIGYQCVLVCSGISTNRIVVSIPLKECKGLSEEKDALDALVAKILHVKCPYYFQKLSSATAVSSHI